MYDKEPNDWVKHRRDEMDNTVREIVELSFHNADRTRRKQRKKERRKERRASWGFAATIATIIGCVATVLGILYAIFCR